MAKIETLVTKRVRVRMSGEERLTVEVFSPSTKDRQSEVERILSLDSVPYGRHWDVLVHVEIRESDGE